MIKISIKIIEKRFCVSDKLEIRKTEDNKKIIEGYAIKWNRLSVEMGYWWKFKERFVKGAFAEWLEGGNDVKALINHDTSKVVGRSKYNTLNLIEDDIGLRYEVELPNTTIGNDLHESVERGDIDGASVGFIMQVYKWDEESDPPIRTVEKAELPEFSFTAFPAYEQTTADTRNKNNNDPYLKYVLEKRKKKIEFMNRQKKINNLKI